MTLPGQPNGNGVMKYIPLGGDGFMAPFAAYAVTQHEVTSDASGGAAALTIIMDDRFCSLVPFVKVQVQQATAADIDCRFSLGSSSQPGPAEGRVLTSIATTVSTTTIAYTWIPVPTILAGGSEPGQIVVRVPNVDGEMPQIDTLVYLFNISVREKTPMGPLLWARGAT